MVFNDLLAPIIAVLALGSGMVAPEFEAVSHDGQKMVLSELRQQDPVMLVFRRRFG